MLTTARTFEDLGVSACNGVGQLLALSPLLNHAGKIVSVEARHAATIRNLLNFGSFVDRDVVNANGLDGARTPLQVMTLADKYFVRRCGSTQFRANLGTPGKPVLSNRGEHPGTLTGQG